MRSVDASGRLVCWIVVCRDVTGVDRAPVLLQGIVNATEDCINGGVTAPVLPPPFDHSFVVPIYFDVRWAAGNVKQ